MRPRRAATGMSAPQRPPRPGSIRPRPKTPQPSSFVIGGLLATTGLAIYLTHASSTTSETATASNLTATAWASPEGGGAVVRGGL